jgi:hypothetical protein
MIILRRVEFENTRVGCCGLTRNDSITPVGRDVDFSMFKKEAWEMMKSYGNQSYKASGDEYSIEYFEGDTTDQNFRESGRSILKFVLEGKKWKMYESGELQFSVSNSDELRKIWQL